MPALLIDLRRNPWFIKFKEKQDLFSSVIWYNANVTRKAGLASPDVIELGKAIKRG